MYIVFNLRRFLKGLKNQPAPQHPSSPGCQPAVLLTPAFIEKLLSATDVRGKLQGVRKLKVQEFVSGEPGVVTVSPTEQVSFVHEAGHIGGTHCDRGL